MPTLRGPDINFLPTLETDDPAQAFRAEVGRLTNVTAVAYSRFLNTLDWPMPIFLGVPEAVPSGWRFRWDPSFDLQGDELVYDFEVSRTPEFAPGDIVLTRPALTGTATTVPLAPGSYFWRVIIREKSDPAGSWQTAFDRYEDDSGKVFPGMRRILIP